ncbi:MAG: hypothetical protein K0R54_2499 [Clostridiaceae bacterium]|nr:hypothetical protein [Clostridiaceae bacterium]
MKPKAKKIVKITSIVIGVIAAFIMVFYGTYYFIVSKSYSEYDKQIKYYTDKINEINNSTASLIKQQTIDSNKSKKDLPSKIDSLIEVKSGIQAINPTEKYYKVHSSLIDGVNNNILIYKQIISIISNPGSKDIEKSLENLKSYRDKCIESYSLFETKKLSVSLSSSTLKFVNNSIFYTSELIRLNKDKTITDGQNSDFINSVDSILNDFISLKTDYNSQIEASRKSKKFNDLLFTISKNTTTYQALKGKLSNIIVPSKGVNLYKALKKTLDSYSAYLDSIYKAVNYENSQLKSADVSNSSIEANYAFSKDKYSTVNDNLEDFYNLYNEFKTKNMK